jgi:subtilisin family serine protease
MGYAIRLAFCAGFIVSTGAAFAADYVEGELLVKFKGGVSTKAADGIHTKFANKRMNRFNLIEVEHVKLSQGKSVEDGILEYSALPEVEYAEPNHYRYAQALSPHGVIPDDPRFREQWGLHNTGQVVQGIHGLADADIDAPEAWRYPTSGNEIVVAVLDSGVGLFHPEFETAFWANPQEVFGDGIDNDWNGFVDDTAGWDFVDNDNTPLDKNKHGTHVAGIIGAVANNANGIAGVCPGIRILPIRISNTFGSSTADASIAAAEYIVGLKKKGVPIFVVNASYGGSFYNQGVYDSIALLETYGILFCTAAGNNSLNNDISGFFPSSYHLPNIISVAASDCSDQLADFSHWGRGSVDLAAPGVSIVSTVPYQIASSDDFEGAYDWTTQGVGLPWCVETIAMNNVLSDSGSGNYLNNTDSYAYRTFPLDLSNAYGFQVGFRCYLDLEMVAGITYDYLECVLATGGTFSPYALYTTTYGSSLGPLWQLSGQSFNWEDWETEYLPTWGANEVTVGFHLVTNQTNMYNGVYIDNVQVRVFPNLGAFNGTEYEHLQGTSMACPMVAGAAAFLKSVEPGLSYADIKSLLLDNVDPMIMPYGKETVTNGRLNLHNAVRSIDYDEDGLNLEDELTLGTDPHNADSDEDGLSDGQEYHETGTDPTLDDTDGDGLSDLWESENRLDPLDGEEDNGPDGDPDNDGLTNLVEYQGGTDPHNPDSDGDGLSDLWESENGLDPLDAEGASGPDGDPDGDGMSNLDEYRDGTDPQVPEITRWDINSDGVVNAVDIQLVVKGALGDDTNGLDTDINGDDVIDAQDIQGVLNAALGVFDGAVS